MKKFRKDLAGKVYGDLTAIEFDYKNSKGGRYFWKCKCVCGNIRPVERSSLTQGKTKNCGCNRRVNHDNIVGNRNGKFTIISFELVRDSIRHHTLCTCQCDCGSVINMRLSEFNRGSRQCKECCDNKTNYTKYRAYTTWEAMKQRCLNENNTSYKYYGGNGISVCEKWLEFEGFFEDMGERPSGMSLDRIDPKGNYTADNCRWTTHSEQAFNTKQQKNNTSGKTGVFYSNKDKKWIARIDYQNKSITLGYFKNKIDAIKAREVAELEFFGYNKD